MEWSCVKDPHYIKINLILPPTHTHTSYITHPHTLGFMCQGLITEYEDSEEGGWFMWGIPVSACMCRKCSHIHACQDVSVCGWGGGGAQQVGERLSFISNWQTDMLQIPTAAALNRPAIENAVEETHTHTCRGGVFLCVCVCRYFSVRPCCLQ